MTGDPAAGNTAAGPLPRPPVEFTDRRDREIRLVELDDDDLDTLEPLYRGYDPRDRAQGIPPATPAGVRRWLDDLGEAHHVAALHGDPAVGHAFLAPEPAEGRGDGPSAGDHTSDHGPRAEPGGDAGPDSSSAELAIFVDELYQDAGIGTRLMETLLGLGAERGVRRVWLVVQRSNGPAVRLYRKTGFEVTAGGRAELEMERELDDPRAT